MNDSETPSLSPRHHLLIAGTGRAGTSALVRLLSACGLETVVHGGKERWSTTANAGAESLVLREAELPYVIKSPWAYQYIDDLLDDRSIILDHVVIPLRRLAHAAGSRIVTEMVAQNAREPDLLGYRTPWTEYGTTPGGILSSFEAIDQQRILGRSLHLLIEALEARAIPFTFLSFPKYVHDVDYAWDRLQKLLPDVTYALFTSTFRTVLSENEVRVESELEEVRTSYAPPGRDQDSHTSIAELRIASLLREIKELKGMLARVSDFNPVCGDPDEAPNGASHGDAVIGPEGLQGWHWVTHRRPENPRYGYQIAHSDTSDLSKIRRISDNVWSPWRIIG